MIRNPDFIIIGSMKCATSTLHDKLAQQTHILMSTPKEPNFFSDDDQYKRGIQWYQSLFASADAHMLCGESSTHYTKLPTYSNTLERLHNHLPNAKLIYVIRHPIDRLVSHYVHEWSERTIREPINEAIYRHPRLVDYSRYAMQLAPFIETYGTDNILLVFFEQFVAQPQAELSRVCEFIGYQRQPIWHEEGISQNVSNQRLQKSMIRDAIVWNPVSTWIRRRFVPQRYRNRIKQLWQMKKKPQLDKKQIDHLEVIFDADLSTLGSWLGIQISCNQFKFQAKAGPPKWHHPSQADPI